MLQNFTVDINAPLPALLPQLAFEGATRRNRPNLKYVGGCLILDGCISTHTALPTLWQQLQRFALQWRHTSSKKPWPKNTHTKLCAHG